jgi:hypothetical protein
MRATSNGNGDDAECTECNPPRKFKSKSGLNGHTQFKHGHLPDSRATIPNGKQSQMYENLTDRVNQLIDQQEELLELARDGNGNGNGNGQVNGNGNGLALGKVNGNGASDEQIGVLSGRLEEPDEPQQRVCENCGYKFDADTHPRNCAGCEEKFDWSGNGGASNWWGIFD